MSGSDTAAVSRARLSGVPFFSVSNVFFSQNTAAPRRVSLAVETTCFLSRTGFFCVFLLSSASAQVLRMGCRVVELDCYDEKAFKMSKGQPVRTSRVIVTHGNTMCGKCKFKDMIIAISENAFVNSQYPAKDPASLDPSIRRGTPSAAF